MHASTVCFDLKNECGGKISNVDFLPTELKGFTPYLTNYEKLFSHRRKTGSFL
jgi:hypothetical protein